MALLKRFYAFFLLLCFLRTLLPEAWVLALHHHEHTQDEPALTLAVKGKPAKAVLTTKHQHCQTDHFCNTPFQPAPPLALAAARTHYQRLTTVALICAAQTAPPATADPRGPPAG